MEKLTKYVIARNRLGTKKNIFVIIDIRKNILLHFHLKIWRLDIIFRIAVIRL